MICKVILILLFDTEYPYKNKEQYHILQNVAMYLSCSLILSFLNLKGLESTSETHTNQSYIHTGICKYEIVLDWNCFSKSYHFYDSFCIQCKIIVQFDKMSKPLKIEYHDPSVFQSVWEICIFTRNSSWFRIYKIFPSTPEISLFLF